MKRIFSVFLMGILIMGTLSSCTMNDELDELLIDNEIQGCCGEEGELDPPPPPPPPPPGGGNG